MSENFDEKKFEQAYQLLEKLALGEEELTNTNLRQKSPSADELYVTLIDGKICQTWKHRHIWTTKSSASQALNSYIRSLIWSPFMYSDPNKIEKEKILRSVAHNQLIEAYRTEHCEIVTVREWAKRGCP